MRHLLNPFRLFGLVIVLAGASFAVRAADAAGSTWWPTSVKTALVAAGTNGPELVTALNSAPLEQREGLVFLLENMPERDLTSLSAKFLTNNLALAYQAFAAAPWNQQVSKELFFNDVLPYVCANESRDEWRQLLREKAAPLIADCKTPGEAALRINQKLFGLLKVRYSTERKKADQSPLETMESGIATCTGLSILLVDACRAVGIPARVAGTPLWWNQRGNHTWVEVWDGGWHFTGAAEADPNGLDRGWFTHDASQARRDMPQHSIYATSFRKTGLAFPMVWARTVQYVSAENVTDRYTPKQVVVDTNTFRLLIKVLDRPAGQRVIARVVVTDPKNSATKFEGVSRGESVDLNDILPFEVARNHDYQIDVTSAGKKVSRDFHTGTNAQEVVLVCLSEIPSFMQPSMLCYVSPASSRSLKAQERSALRASVTDYFTSSEAKQGAWKFSSRFEKMLQADEAGVRELVWEAYQAASVHGSMQADFETNQVRFGSYLSPYTVKAVGTKPAKGWPLFIAMHGGGGAPKEVNDSQWKIMQRYYRDHPETGGYLYVALRAPNDTWNGFYDEYVYPLISNLIRQHLLYADVDANKVFIMGYSHGGYGAFAIGPKMPDRFAAIHASAAAPTEGETTAKTLRNTLFTYMIGEKDEAYGRIARDRKFDAEVQKLRAGNTNIYPVIMQFIAGNGHTGLPDRDKIVEMYSAIRNPVPRELAWLMTDRVISDFFWLRTTSPGKGHDLAATCENNRITVTTSAGAPPLSVLLDSRLVDFSQPVVLDVNGRAISQKLQPSLKVLCDTLQRRGDPELAFVAEMKLPESNN